MLKAPSTEPLNTDAAISYYALALPRKGAQHGIPMAQELILCDADGTPSGFASLEEAHASPGTLHKAFSVYILSPDRRKMLMQKRSKKKPLFAGVWANTCCSHPRQGETMEDAARRRLREECGFDCNLTVHSTFVYRANDPTGNGAEYEFVTILVGTIATDATLKPNQEEIAELKWVDIETLHDDMRNHPSKYAPWFHRGLNQIQHDVKSPSMIHDSSLRSGFGRQA